MEKEALINIILNDIKEVHTLVNTFKGKNELNAAFINLTRTKIANINEELALLEQLNAEKGIEKKTESALTSEGVSNSQQEDNWAIAESSSRFAEGESSKTDEALQKPSEPAKNEPEPIPTQAKEVKDDPVSLQSDPAPVINDSKPIQSHSEPKMNNAEPQQNDVKPANNDSETVTNDSKEVTDQEEVVKDYSESITKDSETVTDESEATPEQIEVNTIKKGVSKTRPAVLGEVINKDNSSVNEAMANKKEQIEDIKQIGKPVSDVKKAFGLNDRFYFQRELFDNNSDLFNQTLDQINQMDCYDSALRFLQSNYSWENDNEATESFYKSIKRRFI
jgi:hypothetical protein